MEYKFLAGFGSGKGVFDLFESGKNSYKIFLILFEEVRISSSELSTIGLMEVSFILMRIKFHATNMNTLYHCISIQYVHIIH